MGFLHVDGDGVFFDQHARERRAGELAALVRVKDVRFCHALMVIGTRHDSAERLN
jgi:hypothetical protein